LFPAATPAPVELEPTPTEPISIEPAPKKKRYRYAINVVRIANKNCNECYVDNGREYDEDDPTRPKFPRHPGCGCGEIEIEVSL
jgi:hypothetical protein